jgi:hypothetical protein
MRWSSQIATLMFALSEEDSLTLETAVVGDASAHDNALFTTSMPNTLLSLALLLNCALAHLFNSNYPCTHFDIDLLFFFIHFTCDLPERI